MDMWETDGWLIIQRDFGSADKAPQYPYFVMYNKFRGLLRVAFFVPDDFKGNAYAGRLRVFDASRDQSSPLFTFSSFPHCFSNDFDTNAVQESLNYSITSNNWLCCDFVMTGYDPQLRNKQISLEFKAFALDLTQIKTSSAGTLTLSQILEDQSPINHFTSPDSLGRTLDAVQSGYSIYKNEQKAMEAIKNGNHGQNASWVTAAIAGASGVAGLGPLASGLAGALTAFLGGGQGQGMPLNFHGTLKFSTEGVLLHSQCAWSMVINLEPSAMLLPGNGTPFGIYNLIEKPRVLDNVVKDGNLYRHTISYLTPPRADINPVIEYDSKELGVAFTFDGARPGVMDSRNTYFPISTTKCTFLSTSKELPSGLAFKLKATPPGPTLLASKPVEILKVYPIDAQPRLGVKLICEDLKRTNREVEAGILTRCILRAEPQDPKGMGAYRYAWTFPESSHRFAGVEAKSGGGTKDAYLEILIREYGNYDIGLNIQDNEGNIATSTHRINLKLQDRLIGE
jgi:hypothetical protein